MQLKFIETINISAITRLFTETFGEPLFWNVAPNTEWVVFSIDGWHPLDQNQKAWLADRYRSACHTPPVTPRPDQSAQPAGS